MRWEWQRPRRCIPEVCAKQAHSLLLAWISLFLRIRIAGEWGIDYEGCLNVVACRWG